MNSDARAARGSFWPILLPWLAAGIIDSAIAATAYVRPAASQFVLELGLLSGMAWSQWTFARGWLRSPLLPALVVTFFGVLPHAPPGFWHAAPFVAGVAVPAFLLVRWLSASASIPPIAGALAAVATVVLVHWVDDRAQQSVTTKPASSSARNEEKRGPPAARAPSIVVLSIDTLRADSAPSMQSVQRLAARGAYWPRAMSTSSWTLPALASLQTGVLPARHGAACLEDSHCQGLSAEIPTLAEELRSAGWTTAAIVANPWAGAGMGFDRGFDDFIDPGQPGRRLILGGVPEGPHGQDDARTIDEAIRWLDTAPPGAFYLWVHLMGPHMPYMHSASEKMRRIDAVNLRSSYPSSAAQKKEIRDSYDAELRYTDAHVLRLLDALEARGVLANGVVAVTADHGEEFWDHGGVEHGHSHHGEIVDVPLLLVAPGLAAGERAGVASLVDVAPTIRAIAGLPGEPGIDLRSGIPADRIATAWGNIVLRLDCSARDQGARLLVQDCSRETSSMRLFDLTRDPGERDPERPGESHRLVAAVRTIEPPARSEAAPVASDRLRALGYLQ